MQQRLRRLAAPSAPAMKAPAGGRARAGHPFLPERRKSAWRPPLGDRLFQLVVSSINNMDTNPARMRIVCGENAQEAISRTAGRGYAGTPLRHQVASAAASAPPRPVPAAATASRQNPGRRVPDRLYGYGCSALANNFCREHRDAPRPRGPQACPPDSGAPPAKPRRFNRPPPPDILSLVRPSPDADAMLSRRRSGDQHVIHSVSRPPDRRRPRRGARPRATCFRRIPGAACAAAESGRYRGLAT
jgi:hypothetical protein